MKHWNIQIDWFDSTKPVLSATSTADVSKGDTAATGAMVVTSCLTVAYENAEWLIRKDRILWDRRRTIVTLHAGDRCRALTIDQTQHVTEDEAAEWAEAVMKWLLADETTELLNA